MSMEEQDYHGLDKETYEQTEEKYKAVIAWLDRADEHVLKNQRGWAIRPYASCGDGDCSCGMIWEANGEFPAYTAHHVGENFGGGDWHIGQDTQKGLVLNALVCLNGFPATSRVIRYCMEVLWDGFNGKIQPGFTGFSNGMSVVMAIDEIWRQLHAIKLVPKNKEESEKRVQGRLIEKGPSGYDRSQMVAGGVV